MPVPPRTLHPVRGRETDGVRALVDHYSQWFALREFKADKSAVAAGLRESNPGLRCSGVRAVRPPVLHELGKCVIAARGLFAAAPHAIGILILMAFEFAEEGL